MQTPIDGFTKRLESAFKLFDEKCRVYQYLFKRNNETIPYKLYGNPVVDAAIKNRIAYLAARPTRSFRSPSITWSSSRASATSKPSARMLAEIPQAPAKALGELCASLLNQKAGRPARQRDRESQADALQKTQSFILK